MKCLTFVSVLLAMLAFLLGAEGCDCPEERVQPGEICGSNGVTYKNRCEFECIRWKVRQRGESLYLSKLGKCPRVIG